MHEVIEQIIQSYEGKAVPSDVADLLLDLDIQLKWYEGLISQQGKEIMELEQKLKELRK